MALITYADKVALNENASIPAINKVSAGDMNEIKNAINNLIWPVGSYYETSDTSFDPNVTWGGTWVLDSAGKVTVARDTTDTDFDTIGETGGEKTHTLTTDEMPSHTHKAVNYVPGYTGGSQSSVFTALYGTSATTTTGNAVKETGGSQAHNNVQPYIVVNRWHRTA